MNDSIGDIVTRFDLAGAFLGFQPFGAGHIHDSYIVSLEQPDGLKRYLLQRLNTAVFLDPAGLMDNVQRVTSHLADHLRSAGVVDVQRRVLNLVPTLAGRSYYSSRAGDYWRVYRYIEDTTFCEEAQTADQVYRAARAYGEFQGLLIDLPGPPLHETIPDFHHTPRRFAALERAVSVDAHGRGGAAAGEIKFASQRRGFADVLLEQQCAGRLPQRVAHNDAKLSNVLFDKPTGAVLCVVDLDTVMPASSLYDFGDMVRSMAAPCAEDAADPEACEISLPLFEALVRGYREATASFLTPAEREHLVVAARLITLEQGVRFLTDFLEGDRYYRTDHPLHNLQRCRTQLRLLESMERRRADMEAVIGRQ